MKSKEEYVLEYFVKNHDELFWNSYNFADEAHKNHIRRDGTPYLFHPLEICYFLRVYRVTEVFLYALALVHDTIEEARDQSGIEITEEQVALKTNPKVARGVMILTKPLNLDLWGTINYFNEIEKDIRTALIKTIDRYANFRRSMFGIFEWKRMQRYVYETKYYILPMTDRIITMAESDIDFPGKETYIEYSSIFRGLRGSIKGILRGAEDSVQKTRQLEKYHGLENENTELRKEITILKNKKDIVK
jgi:(p)ppGpp synthase/HD superfamily hydrolase